MIYKNTGIFILLFALLLPLSFSLPNQDTTLQGQNCEMKHYLSYKYNFAYNTKMTLNQEYPLVISFSIKDSQVTINPYKINVYLEGTGFNISEKSFYLSGNKKTIMITPISTNAFINVKTTLMLDGDAPQHRNYEASYTDNFVIKDFIIEEVKTNNTNITIQNNLTNITNQTIILDNKSINNNSVNDTTNITNNSNQTIIQNTTNSSVQNQTIDDTKEIIITKNQSEDNKTNLSFEVNQNEPSQIPWYMVRIFGLVAFVFLALSIIIALLRRIDAKRFATILKYHCDISYIAVILAFLHGITTIIDKYIWNLSLFDVFFFNFSTQMHTMISLGVISFYFILIIAITSISPKIIMLIKRNNWYYIHLLSYLAFAFVVVHSIFLGTDLSISHLDNPMTLISFSVFMLCIISIIILTIIMMLKKMCIIMVYN